MPCHSWLLKFPRYQYYLNRNHKQLAKCTNATSWPRWFPSSAVLPKALRWALKIFSWYETDLLSSILLYCCALVICLRAVLLVVLAICRLCWIFVSTQKKWFLSFKPLNYGINICEFYLQTFVEMRKGSFHFDNTYRVYIRIGCNRES